MQIMRTPRGDGVAAMKASELLMLDVALSRYVLENPDSHLAIRMLSEVSRSIEEAEAPAKRAAKGSPSN
ncbi:hypothetical protein AB0C11_33655 [Streptomyces sp. NPDC039016]|uniref:hypothetical protein n=1 Tax=Streptomyces sp. NPDC039016 TaxID=3154330 RepID=UPI0033EFA939